jgi:hypothetical protein
MRPKRHPADKRSVGMSENHADGQLDRESLTAKIAVVSARLAHPLGRFRFARDLSAHHRLGPRVLAELLAEFSREHLFRTTIEAQLRRYAERPEPTLIRAVGGDRFSPGPMRILGSGYR